METAMNFRLRVLLRIVSGMSSRTTPFVFIILCQSEFIATVAKGTYTHLRQFITPPDILSVIFSSLKRQFSQRKELSKAVYLCYRYIWLHGFLTVEFIYGKSSTFLCLKKLKCKDATNTRTLFVFLVLSIYYLYFRA